MAQAVAGAVVSMIVQNALSGSGEQAGPTGPVSTPVGRPMQPFGGGFLSGVQSGVLGQPFGGSGLGGQLGGMLGQQLSNPALAGLLRLTTPAVRVAPPAASPGGKT
jgi:hypothetical protein